jgi:hypothetical protein
LMVHLKLALAGILFPFAFVIKADEFQGHESSDLIYRAAEPALADGTRRRVVPDIWVLPASEPIYRTRPIIFKRIRAVIVSRDNRT